MRPLLRRRVLVPRALLWPMANVALEPLTMVSPALALEPINPRTPAVTVVLPV